MSYRKALEAAKKRGQQKADAWNAAHPVGTRVVAFPLTRPEDKTPSFFERLETVTRTPAWVIGGGEVLVSVEGYAGGICLSHVDIAEATS
jgi:hypothetical protein